MESYEQKYKAALEWMQGMYGGLHGKTKEEAEKYFPELAESEDEKIRKEFCKDIWNYIPYEKAHKYIAWLEKQGKSKWTDEDEHHLRMCLECVEECAFQEIEDFSKTTNWLKSLKQRIG